MAITVGTGLGTYEVLALVGPGGRGEVYRAANVEGLKCQAHKLTCETEVDTA